MANNRKKLAAHAAVHRAVKTGDLVKPSACSRCGLEGPVEGHHRDYSKPLDVEWLCWWCHMYVDGKVRNGKPIEVGSIYEAALKSLWSKYRMKHLPFETFAGTIQQNCDVCGCTPSMVLEYKRGGKTILVPYNYLQRDLEQHHLKPICKTCRWLLTNFDLKEVLTTCARIMARKKSGAVDNWIAVSESRISSPLDDHPKVSSK